MPDKSETALQVREQCLAGMPVPLQKIAMELDDVRGMEAAGVLKVRWQIGQRVLLITQEGAANTYGDHAVEQLGAYLSINPTVLYALSRVAAVFTKEQVVAMSKRRASGGGLITPTHLIALAQAELSQEERFKYVERIFAENISANDLEAELAGAHNRSNRRGGGGGRKPQSPKSPFAAAQQMRERFKYIATHQDVWSQATLEAVKEMEPEKYSKPLYEQISMAKDQADDAVAAGSALATDLGKAMNLIHAVLEKREKAAKAQGKEAAKLDKKPAPKAAAKKPAAKAAAKKPAAKAPAKRPAPAVA